MALWIFKTNNIMLNVLTNFKGAGMGYKVDPVRKISSIPGYSEKISNTPCQSKANSLNFGMNKLIFIEKSTEGVKHNQPQTFGEKFLMAIRETVKDMQAQGITRSNANAIAISKSILSKIKKYNSLDLNKINHVA
jgi:hypothetical protein